MAFRLIKERLVSAPVSYCPDFSRPFIIQTDANDYGIVVVLTQEYSDGEHVISYINQKECLAVIWAIEKFRGYVEGYHFKVITDHHSLIWLQNLQNPTGKLCRWALGLQAFDFEIVHRKDSSHVVPDALSRAITKIDIVSKTVNPWGNVVCVSATVNDRWYTCMLVEIERNPIRFTSSPIIVTLLMAIRFSRGND